MQSNDERPNPDELLGIVQAEEAQQKRAKLKIFLGAAAGVGKTYAMLEAAHERQAEGVDVVAGWVDTHEREETKALLAGLEALPRRQVPYRDVVLEEMDLDALLARAPELALVDEAAHTNAPGVRHRKRHQDILDLLDARIDVYTTINVQHFESRADAVRQITGVTVHETVPDSFLDLADEIELIDLPPEELRKRLAEGKVYTVERADVAAKNFFRIGNLTALREMALRLAAEHVDHKLQSYMQLKRIAGPWRSRERLMVAIGPSPFSEQLVRWARRMAYTLEAPWLAVHVEGVQPLSDEETDRLARNLDLARKLGGEVVLTAGSDVVETLLHVARQHNVTQIVIGKPLHGRFARLFGRETILQRLVRTSGTIDIHVVTGRQEEEQPRMAAPRPAPSSSWWHYILALGLVGLATGLNLFAAPFIGYQAVGLTALLVVLLIAVYIGRGPALVAAAASALTWNYLFIPPYMTFAISTPADILLFVLYFVIALFTGNLTARLRTQERQARYSAERANALYQLAMETGKAPSLDEMLTSAVAQIGRVFDAEVAIILPGQNGAPHPHPVSTLALDDKDLGVARWVLEHGKPAGRFTETLPLHAKAQFLPLLTSRSTLGVLAVRTRRERRLSGEQEILMATFVGQVALVMERELLSEAAAQSAMLAESERLYTTLLNSISHELRTPLATITGAASSLSDTQLHHNAAARAALLADIYDAAERLNRLVENLLDMSRLESGRLQIKREWCDIGELISVAVDRAGSALAGRPLTIQVAPSLPLVSLDFGLVEQALTNLLVNAAQYTPTGAPVEVNAALQGGDLVIAVTDHGPGVPPEALEHLFDKFYRVPGSTSGGTGLGLSIAHGLVEAHSGRLTAENIRTGGLRLTLRLPLGAGPPPVQEAAL